MSASSWAARSGGGIRKNRERLACRECRQRKLKCDRDSPCGSCVRRRDGASCSYEPHGGSSENSRERRTHAEARLEHLEHLVELLAGQRTTTPAAGNVATPPATLTEDRGATGHSSGGSSTHEPSHLACSGTTHWSAMLEDIHALRSTLDSFADENTDAETASAPRADAGIGVLFGADVSRTPSIEEVLNRHLPSRRDTDRLVSTYFRVRSAVAPFIHSSQFQRQYQAFWSRPGETSPLWISILFSVLFIATNTFKPGGETERTGSEFTVAAAQCLAIGEYFRPKAFAVEALLLYAQSQYIASLELPPDMGSVLSILVRLATVAGYHRESGALGLSPFTMEMRRRAWSVCMQLDLLVSFHMGVPSSVQFSAWDSQIPINLVDSDFDEDSVQLPPPRPNTELTGVLFCIMKHRFMAVFEKTLQHVLVARTHEATDAEIDSLDAEIKDVYGSLPEVFRLRPITDSIVDPPHLIITRLCISFIYYKCLCVLHRLHVTKLRADSIRECYAASVALVQNITDLYEECRTGGQLDTEEWFMKSITWNDLLLGATALCLVLCTTGQNAEEYRIDMSSTLTLLKTARTVIHVEQAGGKNKDSSRVLSVVNATILQHEGQDNHGLVPSVAGAAISPPRSVRGAPRQGGSETGVSNGLGWSDLDGFLDGFDYGL
ncbi:hypothetical protein F5Y10DRAFT_238766 [Nemania abortiva]|nr:hypothetical protein F5Y10DRAFT_238766 [Nemania abortiva]